MQNFEAIIENLHRKKQAFPPNSFFTKNHLHIKCFSRTSSEKTIFFCSIRCYTCIQIFRHKLHSHKMPSHVFINCLKAETFSAFLICGGSLLHIFGPRTLKRFCQILISQFLRLSNSDFTDNGQIYQIIYLPQCLTKKHGFN